MQDFSQPTNELERALARVRDAGDDLDGSARQETLRQLALNSVVVLIDQLITPESPPDLGGRPMFVSNGEDREQAMLAIFSTTERAQAYLETLSPEIPYYPFEVPGPRALLAVADDTGIRVNPNQELGFVILPDLAKLLKQDVQAAMERTQQRQREQGQ